MASSVASSVASLSHPRRCYGLLNAFYRVPMEFYVAFHGTCTLHCACVALLVYALRFHGVCTALPMSFVSALTAYRSLIHLYVCF